jgi:CPA1 family monovalent cation:H+ antiporter
MNGAQLLLVVIAAIAVTAIAQRRNLQPPLVLVTLGLAVSFIPGLPQLEIEPEVILGVVLPPLLYSTAVEFSVVNFLRNLWPIMGLGVVLVLVTALAAGLVGSALVPEMSLAAGLVLGAVVGPSDAVTAVAIGSRLGLPRRLMTILTGESLINDAAALTLFSIATVSVTGQTAFISRPVPFFLYEIAIALIIGRVLAGVAQWIQRRLENPGLETVLGLVLPFAAYTAAEAAHASGVIAVVTAGFSIGHNAARTGYAARIQERQVWRSLDVLLEAFVFAYMGLQMKFVVQQISESRHSLAQVLFAAVMVLLVVMAVRPAYVFVNRLRLLATRAFLRRQLQRHPEQGERIRRRRRARRAERRRGRGGGPEFERSLLPIKQELVVSWTGMRGVVTLAAAAGIPMTVANGSPFPGRAMIQVIAFVVAVGTLLVQGFTLPPFIRRLGIRSDSDEEYAAAQRRHAMEVTREVAAKVMKRSLAEADSRVDPHTLQVLTEQLQRLQQNRQQLREEADAAARDNAARDKGARGNADQVATDSDDTLDRRDSLWQAVGRVRIRMVEAQRKALTAERDAFRLDDDIYREMLEQLDYDEAAMSSRMNSRL